MDEDILEDSNEIDRMNEKINYLMSSMSNFYWMKSADESKIDSLFNLCVEIQEKFLQEEEQELHKEIMRQYYWFDFSKALELFLENIIKNPYLNEQLTLYAIEKYTDIYPKGNINEFIESILDEGENRQNLVGIIEKTKEAKVPVLNWEEISLLIEEITLCNPKECNTIILGALKAKTQILLNALEHGSLTVTHSIVQKVITCLEDQPDLKLWFIVMKLENIDLVLKLCLKFNNFYESVLKFFDRFAEEVECNFDEELNVKYSHLNLDFDDFIEVLKTFLNNEKFNSRIKEFLESKILFEENSFLFWVDVKACLSDSGFSLSWA